MLSRTLTVSMFIFSLLGVGVAFVKLEYFMKERAANPEITCMTCHKSIPAPGDQDKKLNDAGKQYQKTK